MSASVRPTVPPLTLPSDQDISGRTLGAEEVALLAKAIASGTLTSTKGEMVKQLEASFAAQLEVRHAHACSSGTAAVHTAMAALDPEPGDEIITSPITDMGALTPILYQAAIPVFADVDRWTCNVTAETIAARLSPRTRAIIVTHLFGNPCAMEPIMDVARTHNLPVIEDCAQAFLAQDLGQTVGTVGTIGCFSLQQGKHITTGEGGLVVTNDTQLARRMYLFINKAWGYGDPNPDHTFLALNYRMSELQGAVALAQLPKLEGVVRSRVAAADLLAQRLAGLPGITLPPVRPGSVHTYWKYCVHVDEKAIPGGTVGLAKQLRQNGIACAPRYIQKPAFRCEVFQKQRTFGTSRFPFSLARPEAVDYDARLFPGAFAALDTILVLPWNERYTEEHVTYIADAIHAAVQAALTGRSEAANLRKSA
jgi:dTDP-4-amino-4,6-dideoxygalactose transaminase